MTTMADVARFFGLSRTHIKTETWFNLYQKTRPAKGYYLPDLVWIRTKQMRGYIGEDGEEGTITDARRKVLKQDAIKKERENQIATGELYPRNDVDMKAINLAISIRTGLMSLPIKVATVVPGQQKSTVENLVKAEVTNALIRIRDMRLSESEVRTAVLDWAKEILEEEAQATPQPVTPKTIAPKKKAARKRPIKKAKTTKKSTKER